MGFSMTADSFQLTFAQTFCDFLSSTFYLMKISLMIGLLLFFVKYEIYSSLMLLTRFSHSQQNYLELKNWLLVRLLKLSVQRYSQQQPSSSLVMITRLLVDWQKKFELDLCITYSSYSSRQRLTKLFYKSSQLSRSISISAIFLYLQLNCSIKLLDSTSILLMTYFILELLSRIMISISPVGLFS